MDNIDNETLLKNLWNTIKTDDIKDSYEKVLETWKDYSTKLKEGSLKLDEFTNLKTKKEDEYLSNYLERTSKIFGTSRGGNSNQYMLKRNALEKPKNKTEKEDKQENEIKETYYIKTKDKKEKTEATRDEAEKYYKDYILPLFQNVNNGNKEELIALENSHYNGFEAVQILRKMVILNDLENKKFDYVQVFKDEILNKLYLHLVIQKGNVEREDEVKKIDFYTKNSEVAKAIKEIINQDSNSIDVLYMVKLSRLLWKFENQSFDEFPDEEAPNVIFYGAPGTGKTHIVNEYLKIKQIDEKNCVRAQFHPSYTYEDFIDGIKPTGIEGNQVKLELCNGMFKDLCIKAKNAQDEKFYFIADEINRANLSSVFGETLSLLEAGYRDNPNDKSNRHLIQLQNSKIAEKSKAETYEEDCRFGIPKNVYFIGMMNDVDKSIDAFDLALRRRFRWVRKDCDYDVIENEINKEGIEDYINNCKALNAYISGVTEDNKSVKESLGLGKAYEFGHSFFLKMKNIAVRTITKTNKEKLFEDYLRPTLKEYLRSFSTELEIEQKLDHALKIFCDNE